jgi:chromosome segregation ATPase
MGKAMTSEAIQTFLAAMFAALPGLWALYNQYRKDAMARQSEKEKNSTSLEEVNQTAARALVETMTKRIDDLESDAERDRKKIDQLITALEAATGRIRELEKAKVEQAELIERQRAELVTRNVEMHTLRDVLQVKTLEIDRLRIELDQAGRARLEEQKRVGELELEVVKLRSALTVLEEIKGKSEGC